MRQATDDAPAQGVAWAAINHAVVVSEDLAEAALRDLELNRAQYAEDHRTAAGRIATWALELGRPDLNLRARLIDVDIEFRHGDVIAAAKRAREILTAAEQMGELFIMARSHLLLCDAQHSLGDSPSARINGIRSVELLADDVPIGIRVDHLRSLGTAYGPGPDSERCHTQALDLVNVIGDAARAIGIHNSLAYFAFVLGDFDRATEHAHIMTELSTVRQIPLVASQLDTAARVLMMSGRTEAAIDLLRPLIPNANDPSCAGGVEDLDSKPYALPECMLTLAEAHRDLGRFATAQQALNSSLVLAKERHLGRVKAHVLDAQAQLYAELGDFRRAFDAHIAYHAATLDLRSDEREMRARLIQASYDAEELQRDEERFRDLALRDSLTGLHNRRFLDEALRTAIKDAAAGGRVLSVAIADADFFKRINDELSHEVGDDVLRHLATILAAAAVPPESVGRLGGEEFLILLPDTDETAASSRCETIRRAVAAYDFGSITGALPVTISLGVATATGPTTAAELLAAADRNLYAAKRSGRNRVMPAPR